MEAPNCRLTLFVMSLWTEECDDQVTEQLYSTTKALRPAYSLQAPGCMLQGVCSMLHAPPPSAPFLSLFVMPRKTVTIWGVRSGLDTLRGARPSLWNANNMLFTVLVCLPCALQACSACSACFLFCQRRHFGCGQDVDVAPGSSVTSEGSNHPCVRKRGESLLCCARCVANAEDTRHTKIAPTDQRSESPQLATTSRQLRAVAALFLFLSWRRTDHS
jgi:hypothetical protein